MTHTIPNAVARADAYKFLSECYHRPDIELEQKVAATARNHVFFAGLARHVDSSLELAPLEVDYAALFVGPYELLAPPYGSVYLEDSRMMGDSTIDVRNCYESENLDLTIKDAPDHIAAELEFNYYLVTKQIQAAQEGNLKTLQSYEQKQRSFLQIHLARWVSRFAERVRSHALTSFYRDIADLTEVFIRENTDACSRRELSHRP